ncbi:substrate-binding domain-containing protein [Pandoraea pnomenusa]|uniref:substrate-binding domain-containing protein n=1 Tax=Pandoraea pnomenusa TaxID=93220 RepID=UPI0033426068
MKIRLLKLVSAFAVASSLVSLSSVAVHAAEVVHVYGPGGPAPAMKEAAKVFGQAHDVQIEVTAGPTPKWVDQAKQNADVVFSGAENMMSDFARAMPGVFELANAEPLYLRPAAILVRPGNPKHIKGFRDLLQPGVKVMAVAGAGQVGLWEDVAGRTGDIATVRAFRKNLKLPEAANSAMALADWTQDKSIDAWLIWNIWQVANPDAAQVVDIEEPYRIYRDAGVVLTKQGAAHSDARSFVDFLKSPQGAAIFAKWGWKTN